MRRSNSLILSFVKVYQAKGLKLFKTRQSCFFSVEIVLSLRDCTTPYKPDSLNSGCLLNSQSLGPCIEKSLYRDY